MVASAVPWLLAARTYARVARLGEAGGGRGRQREAEGGRGRQREAEEGRGRQREAGGGREHQAPDTVNPLMPVW